LAAQRADIASKVESIQRPASAGHAAHDAVAGFDAGEAVGQSSGKPYGKSNSVHVRILSLSAKRGPWQALAVFLV